MSHYSFLRINSSQELRQRRFSKLGACSTSYLLLENCGPWRAVLLYGKSNHMKGTGEGEGWWCREGMRFWRGVRCLERTQDSGKMCGAPGRAQGLGRKCEAPGKVWGPQERCEALERGPRRSMRPQGRCRTLQRGVWPQRSCKAAGRVSSRGRVPSQHRAPPWGRIPSQGRVSP